MKGENFIMSLIKFNNSLNTIECIIYSEEIVLEGVARPSLRFRFENDEFDLPTLSNMFTPENCKVITIIEDDGSEFIYENYTVRYKLALELENEKDQEGNYSSKEFINITMAKKTPLELQYEELAISLEETQLALLEIYEAQGVNL